jgi:hypothetical protein
MKIIIQNPKSYSRNLIRQAGYAIQQNREGEINFVRRIQGADYPRFHIYIKREEPGEIIEMELHLDEKKPSYEGYKAHSGQYEGEVIQRECDRIMKTIDLNNQ